MEISDMRLRIHRENELDSFPELGLAKPNILEEGIHKEFWVLTEAILKLSLSVLILDKKQCRQLNEDAEVIVEGGIGARCQPCGY